MKKNSILALGLLALAASVSSFAVGGGLSLLKGNEAVAVKAEDGVKTTYVHGDMTGLTTSSATTKDTSITSDDGIEYVFSKGAKTQSSSGSNKLTNHSAVLIGKSGAYIYNKTAFGTGITSFKIYSNGTASKNVSVGVYFSSSLIDKYSATSAQYSATLSTADSVYDLTSKIPAGATYFWYQVTSSNNSQIQFEITYSNSTEPVVSVKNGSDIVLGLGKTSQYSLTTLNLSADVALEAASEDPSVAEVSLSDDDTQLNVAAKALGETAYTVSAKDSTGTTIATFAGKITVQNEPVKILFGTASGSWNFNSDASSFEDANGNAWKGIATGASYFDEKEGYSQIGSNSTPAKSIAVTGSLGGFYSIDSVSGVFSGNSGASGDVSIKAGSLEIGKGNLNGTTNVIVSSSSSFAFADTISFEITNISKGLKLISLEYVFSEIDSALFTEVDDFVATYITLYSGEAKEGETCKSKYENASDAYNKLSEKGQQLFDIHTNYAGAKAIFDYWYSATSTDAKGTPLAAAKASEIASVSSIGLFAVGGVVVLGLFFVNKKKAE